MNLLAFDTSLDKMYIALHNGKELLESETVETVGSTYHSAYLISKIASILKKHNLAPKDVNALAVNIGPGSFTGIRACTTVARVMAQQLNIPAIGVSSLEIIAKIAPENKQPLVALDARKNKAYLFDGEIKGARLLDEVKEMITPDKYLITDNRLQPVLGGISYQTDTHDFGKILCELAQEKIKTQNCEWQKLHPLYIQPAPIFGK